MSFARFGGLLLSVGSFALFSRSPFFKIAHESFSILCITAFSIGLYLILFLSRLEELQTGWETASFRPGSFTSIIVLGFFGFLNAQGFYLLAYGGLLAWVLPHLVAFIMFFWYRLERLWRPSAPQKTASISYMTPSSGSPGLPQRGPGQPSPMSGQGRSAPRGAPASSYMSPAKAEHTIGSAALQKAQQAAMSEVPLLSSIPPLFGMTEVKRLLEKALTECKQDSNHHNGILLYGPPGNGKTMLARYAAARLELPFIDISQADFASPWLGQETRALSDTFDAAIANAPSVLFIDEIDSILKDRSTHGAGNSGAENLKLANAFLAKSVEARRAGVIIVSATNFFHQLDAAAFRDGRFDYKIEVPNPKEEDIVALLEAKLFEAPAELLKRSSKRLLGLSSARIVRISELAQEFCDEDLRNQPPVPLKELMKPGSAPAESTADFTSVTAQIPGQIPNPSALAQSSSAPLKGKVADSTSSDSKKSGQAQASMPKPPKTSRENPLQTALKASQGAQAAQGGAQVASQGTTVKKKIPSAKTLTWTHLQKALRQSQGAASESLEGTPRLSELAQEPQTHHDLSLITQSLEAIDAILDIGGRAPTGALFFGPPGTGKTLAAKALAAELQWAFHSANGFDLSRDAGAMDAFFDKASASRPCIAFIDEAEDLLMSRQMGSVGFLTGKMLSLLDGAHRKPMDVFLICASNHPERIDPAFLRPGRFGVSVSFELPSLETRVRICQHIMRKNSASFMEELSAEPIAALMDSFSPAQIQASFDQALTLAALTGMKQASLHHFEKGCHIIREHQERAG